MADYAMTIDGVQVGGADFGVVNPATARVVARAPACTPEQLDRAMMAAARAFPIWSRADDVRRAVLGEAAATVLASVAELARLVTAEQGKTRSEAVAEVRAASRWLRYYAGLDIPRQVVRDRRAVAEVLHRPLGVVAAIPARNNPVGLAVEKIAPALRAGNTMVLKPSPYTPLATLELGRLLSEVLPPGVLNVVSGPEPLGAQLVTHRTPRMVSFTGSTATGRWVATAAGAALRRVTLELGGNDPAIVLDDADPEAIADALFWAAFANNGQRCRAVKRVYVARSRYRAMVEALAARARAVRVGNGSQRTSQLGPVGTRPQLDRIAELVRDALARGAVAAAGGTQLRRPGYFFAPTILAGVSDGVRVVDEEQFGPVLPVIGYRDLDEAVRRANGTGYRLAASVWSPDSDRAAAVAARLEARRVAVNDHAGGIRPDPLSGHPAVLGPGNGLSGYTDLQVLSRPVRNGEGAPVSD
ncbi:aldehyde dehydrogenase family protein [Jatrophihabitans sp.]|uniref:aldehyde dehydrogenase family protein n=1 Tax=Jatrophihabitans sp. TaxID=1932789 RepID=UPI002C514392|nr:aldehyde dehydrogenase family protein [Jatrophihabitans sp.]